MTKVRSHQIVDFLREYHLTNGYPPSVREVADHFGVGVSTSHRHLKALLATEEITAQSGRSRTWRPATTA